MPGEQPLLAVLPSTCQTLTLSNSLPCIRLVCYESGVSFKRVRMHFALQIGILQEIAYIFKECMNAFCSADGMIIPQNVWFWRSKQ